MKKLLLRFTFTFSILTTLFNSSFSQMVGPDCYIKGNLVEIGINGPGGFEGVDLLISVVYTGNLALNMTSFIRFSLFL